MDRRLVLVDALPHPRSGRYYDLIVTRWGQPHPRMARAWASDSGLSGVLHTARIEPGDENGSTIVLKLGHDPYWRWTGEARFHIDHDARYTGQVRIGSQETQQVSGRVERSAVPSRLTLGPIPEHTAGASRLFGQIERLRDRVRTPWGARIRDRLQDAAQAIDLAHIEPDPDMQQERERGPAHQAAICATAALLLDDAAQARRAWQICQRAALLPPSGDPWQRHREDIHLGPVLGALAVTYDAGRAWWTAAQRDAFRSALAEGLDLLWSATIDERHMSGTNLAHWSNRNAIRKAGAAIVALVLLDDLPADHPLAPRLADMLTHAAVSLSAYLHDAYGDGGICLEGHYYKHMVWRRGLAWALLGYREVLGVALAPPAITRHLIAGEWLVQDIDHHSNPGSLDAFWPALWLTADPADHGWLWSRFRERGVGMRIAPALLLATLAALPDQPEHLPQGAEPPWMLLDGRKGCHLFRPQPQAAIDPRLALHQKRDLRASCHYERFGVAPGLFWFGHGRRWFAGSFLPQPVDDPGMHNTRIGPRARRPAAVNGRQVRFAFDLTPELWRYLSPKRIGEREAALDAGARQIDHPHWGPRFFDHGWRGRRDVLVDGSGVGGLPLVVLIVDRFARADPRAPDPVVQPAPGRLAFPFLADGLTREQEGTRLTYRDAQGVALSAWALAPTAWHLQPMPHLRSDDGVFVSLMAMHGTQAPRVDLLTHDGQEVVVAVGEDRVRLVLAD